MSKHTPGPWTAVDQYSDALCVIDSRGFEIVEARSFPILLDYAEKLGIDHWADSPAASLDLTQEEQAANSRLIAAAPELLAACQAIVEYQRLIDSGATSGLLEAYSSAFEGAEAAIAKATT